MKRTPRPASTSELAALAGPDHSALTKAIDGRYYVRLCKAIGAIGASTAIAYSTGPLWGYDVPDASTATQVALGPVVGFLSLFFCAIVGILLSLGPFGWLMRRRISALEARHGWRPREGARHPKGRTDTQDRFVIEREPVESGLSVVLARFAFDGKRWRRTPWEGQPETRAVFAPGQDDELAAHETRLRSMTPDREREALEAAVVDAADAEAERVRAQAAAKALAEWQRQRGGELVV